MGEGTCNLTQCDRKRIKESLRCVKDVPENVHDKENTFYVNREETEMGVGDLVEDRITRR